MKNFNILVVLEKIISRSIHQKLHIFEPGREQI